MQHGDGAAPSSRIEHGKRRGSLLRNRENHWFTCRAWRPYDSVSTLVLVAQVSFTVDADMKLRRTVGLRVHVERAVLGVLETALELSKLGGGNVRTDATLVMRVGSLLVAYSLDLEGESVTIWRAEPLQESAA